MRCDPLAIASLADGELGWLKRQTVRRHIARCPACARQFAAVADTSAALKAGLARHRASPELLARIAASLPSKAPEKRPIRWRMPVSFGTAAGAFAGVALTLLVQTGIEQRSGSSLVRLAIDAHTAAIVAHHEIDIADSDRHVVKPWLSARIDVSPPVCDLRPFGFFLVGGRIDHLGSRAAAVVVYRHDNHRIDVFAWPESSKADAKAVSESRQGFNTVRWTQAGIGFLAVSDLEPDELAILAARIMLTP